MVVCAAGMGRETGRFPSDRWVAGRARSSLFRPAAAQIDQLHAATRANSSLFSAPAVTRNVEMLF